MGSTDLKHGSVEDCSYGVENRFLTRFDRALFNPDLITDLNLVTDTDELLLAYISKIAYPSTVLSCLSLLLKKLAMFHGESLLSNIVNRLSPCVNSLGKDIFRIEFSFLLKRPLLTHSNLLDFRDS